MNYTAYQVEQYEVNDSKMHEYFELWWSDWEEAGVERVYVAEAEDGEIVGFQSINGDRQTVAIEVKDAHRGNGVALLLIEESGSFKPERNENPEFWAKVADSFT